MRPPTDVGDLPFGAVPGDEHHLVEALMGLEARVANPPHLLQVADAPEIGGEHGVEAALVGASHGQSSSGGRR
jgi:hypothetical protein